MKQIRPYKQKFHNENKKTAKKIELVIIIVALLFFTGFFTVAFYGTKTLIKWNTIIRIYLTIALVVSLFPNKFLPLSLKKNRELKLLMSVCGIAPITLGLSLMLNYKTAQFNRLEAYKIEKCKIYYSEGIMNVQLKNNLSIKHIELRNFSLDKFNFQPDSAIYEVSKGILGMEIISNSYLTKKQIQ